MAAVQFVAQQFQLVAQVSSDLSGLAEELLSRLAQASVPLPPGRSPRTTPASCHMKCD